MLWTLRYTYILYIYHRPSHPSFIPIQWSESNLIFSSPSAILPLPSQECSETEDHVTVQISKHLCRYLDISVCRCIQVLWLVSVSMVSVCIYGQCLYLCICMQMCVQVSISTIICVCQMHPSVLVSVSFPNFPDQHPDCKTNQENERRL